MSNILFAGTPDFAQTILEALLKKKHTLCAVLTQPDKKAGRGQKIQAPPVKICANQNDIPVLQPHSLKQTDIQNTLRAFNLDLIIVAAYGLILPKAALDIPKLGCVNVHASCLPRFRGAAPIQHAILAGDQQTGITLMQMDQGLDTGDLLKKYTCNITAHETSQTLHDKLAKLGAKAIQEQLDAILNQTLTPVKQNEAQATYAPKIQKQDAQLHWADETAQTIDRKIRAFNPWPVAFSTLNKYRIRIYRATRIAYQTTAKPGTIVEANPKTGLWVATQDQTLSLEVIQLPGKKPLAAKALLNAHRDLFVVGKQFT